MKKRGELSNGLPEDPLSGGDSEPRPAGLDRATELKLIDAALLDNIKAFSELFEHYRTALYGLCCRRLNDFALAEDVVQEVFLKAFKNLPNSDYRKPIWPWLAAIAHRMCIDLQRRRSLIHYSGDIRLTMDEDAETNGHGHTESALDAVIASEDRAEVWKSLDVLPERQRRAFVLYEVDGLSCADIAFAEGISVAAVYRLLFRARKKLRAAHQGGRPLPAIVFPSTWLSWKLQRIGERIRIVLGVYGEGFSTACVQAVCLSTVAMIVVATGNSAEPFNGNDAVPSDQTVLSATQSRPLQTGSLPTALQNLGAPAKAPSEPQQPVASPASSLVDGVINPNQSATPESTSFHSIMASPNYESDHTILASGYANGYPPGHVVFVSHDGGANWQSTLFRPFVSVHTAVLSPDYPQDRRMFALGDLGLEQSDDGGAIFRPVGHLASSLGISPSFGRGDSKVLIGAKTLLEYDADTGVTRPSSLAIAPSWGGSSYSSIAFSPNYASDSTVFVSDRYGKGNLVQSRFDQTILYRCKESVCDETEFPFSGPLTLRLSPRFDQDGLAYAFAFWKLLVSNDGGQEFRDLQFPLPNSGFIQDVAISWDTPSDPAIFVSASGISTDVYRSVIYRSLDAGRSWNSTWIDSPGFRDGGGKLIVTPTGRLLATGRYGIVCSENGGLTWAPRCTPEP